MIATQSQRVPNGLFKSGAKAPATRGKIYWDAVAVFTTATCQGETLFHLVMRGNLFKSGRIHDHSISTPKGVAT